MRNIGIKYYKMGLYTEKQFALFVTRGYVSHEEFKEITGMDYEKVVQQDESKVGY
ncbi:XkdX family protein [Staphylococcus sp. IVB6227]|uniref:XkdX family protein n=1 Tax=Staphylococcus sp. IVB6227 TaxID=2989768 RepID=UPI0021CF2E0F|nr:XkdX family protein [Staphylococcus sp. IVB6227]UXR79067.1 XkdX family protein [Staphylococcus sp. IVB6227]